MKLHDYQIQCVKHILNNPQAALFLACGLGKTVITLTALSDLLFDYFSISKVLIVAPLRVAQTVWQEETQKWDHLKHLKCSKVLGTVAQRRAALEVKANIYIINRENVKWLCANHKWDFDCLVLDELSSFKNQDSQRFKALKKQQYSRIIGLTATPASNGLIDLWSQMYLIDQGKRLEKYISHYRSRYFHIGAHKGDIVYEWLLNTGAEDLIYKRIEDICISMRNKIKLPPITYNNRFVSLSRTEKALYDKLEDDLVLKFNDKTIAAPSAAVLSGKLLQLASGSVYNDKREVLHIHRRKLDELEELLEELNGQHCLIVYNYKHSLEKLAQFPALDIEKWNAKKQPIALCHPASCGHGINLFSGGHIIIWFDMTWSLELFIQMNSRLYRQGQNKPVQIHHILAKDTLDEKISKALVAKENVQKALLDYLLT